MHENIVPPASEGWKLLECSYECEGLVLVLGAGVSYGSRLPSWEDLLRGLAERILGPEDGPVLFDGLKDRGHRFPTIAGMIEQHWREDRRAQAAQDGTSILRGNLQREYAEIVREELYARLRAELAAEEYCGLSQQQALVEHTRRHNPTLTAVAALCVQRTRATGATDVGHYQPNRRIYAVLTLNVDDLLQLYARGYYRPARLLRTVERPSAQAGPGLIRVYHIHGHLRFDRSRQRPDKEAADALVFTEQEYYEFVNRPTGLFTYTFLHLLREHPCLFIGCSMYDDNIRRLLHYSREERRAALEAEGIAGDEATRQTIRHFAILKRDHMPEPDRLTAISLQRLGVIALWVDDFAEIPGRLHRVYESAGAKWDSVC